jgi:hypothetical protein
VRGGEIGSLVCCFEAILTPVYMFLVANISYHNLGMLLMLCHASFLRICLFQNFREVNLIDPDKIFEETFPNL